MNAVQVWKLASSVAWRDLDGEVVVFHAETGDTHHLGPIASGVLRALARQSSGLRLHELVHRVGEVDATAADRMRREIQHALDELAHLNIAAPVAA